jgi:hypothetical protein
MIKFMTSPGSSGTENENSDIERQRQETASTIRFG